MAELKRLSDVGLFRDKHHHIVFLDEKQGVGLCSTDAGHTHEIQYRAAVPEQPPQQDEMGNEVAPGMPGQPAAWLVYPGPDGHTHEIEEYVTKSKKAKKEKDEEVLTEVLELWRTASQLEGDSIKKGRESEEFYMGKQWEGDTPDKLKALDRACLTINRIAKYVEQLSGYQRQQRADIHYVPTKGGKQRAADVMNAVSKNILEQCYFAREESKVFEDMVISGRGVFKMFMDYSSNLRGDLKIRRQVWDEVRFGPHEMEDLSDCEYVLASTMFSLERLKSLFGDKVEEIEGTWALVSELDDIPGPSTQWSDDEYAHKDNNNIPLYLGGSVMLDISKKEIRLLECWRNVYQPSTVLAMPEQDFYFNATLWDKKDIDSASTIDGIRVIKKNLRRIRITKCVPGVLLSDENPANLPEDDFYFIPAYARKRGSAFWGKVENAKDPQREVNYRRSQMVDIGNKMVAYNYFIDPTTFPDEQEEKKFIEKQSQPGATFKVNDLNRTPVKSEGAKFPQELANMIEIAHAEIAEAMNIAVENGGANTSGAAYLQQQRMRLTGNEFLFDNLSMAKTKIGRLLIKVIQKYYGPDRILNILQSENEANGFALEGQPLSEYSEEEILQILQDTDLSQVDVVVTESSYSPTVRLALLTVFENLQAKGVQIPFETYVELLDIPQQEKQKILSQYAQQSQDQATQAQETSKMEINKTLIAKGIIPPEIQADLQRQQAELQQQNGGQNGVPPQFSPTDENPLAGY